MTISYAAIGAVGGGFSKSSLEEAIDLGIDFVGADAGSTDLGAFILAGHGTMFPESTCKRDLKTAITLCKENQIPLLVGSSGGSGSSQGVEWFEGLVSEIAREEHLNLKVSKIYSDLSSSYVKGKIADSKVRPLLPEFDFTEDSVDASIRMVGVMGVEPFQRALESEPDIILAGRASDAAIFAALPLVRGIDSATAWHAGKTAECGAVAAWPPKLDCLYVRLDTDFFEVQPLDSALSCTPSSVAAQQLYESADPFRLVQPSGVLDTEDSVFEPVSDSRVRVSGARFEPTDKYTIKIESAEFVGHRKFFILSIRDPLILENLSEWLEEADNAAEARIVAEYGDSSLRNVKIHARVYGVDGTMGSWEPAARFEGHEAVLLVDVVSLDADLAGTVANVVWYTYLHHPIKYWKGYGTLACPYYPMVMDQGPVFRFNANHVMEVESPLEPFRFEATELVGK